LYSIKCTVRKIMKDEKGDLEVEMQPLAPWVNPKNSDCGFFLDTGNCSDCFSRDFSNPIKVSSIFENIIMAAFVGAYSLEIYVRDRENFSIQKVALC